MLLQLDNVSDIVITCALLHYFLTRSKWSRLIYTPAGSFDTDREDGIILRGLRRDDQNEMISLLPLQVRPRRAPLSATVVRNHFAEYFKTNGSVAWQNNY